MVRIGTRRYRRQVMVGYALILLLLLGLVYLVYWMVVLGGGRRQFKNIEKMRGDLNPAPPPIVEGDRFAERREIADGLKMTFWNIMGGQHS